MPYFILEKSASLPRDKYDYTDDKQKWYFADGDGFAAEQEITPYATRPEAFEIVKRDGLQTSHRIEFIATSGEINEWRYRERNRYVTGQYIHVPWHTVEIDKYRDHFVHMSLKIPGMVAYTDSVEKGLQDRQTRLTPGRYLDRFYAETFSRADIAEYVAKVQAFADCKGLRLATSRDDIRAVYTNGPTSCMGGGPDHTNQYWRPSRLDGHYPTDVYAHPSDLAVAYVGDLDACEISQRCVVWPDKKVYSRIYGTGPLEHILRDNGYREGSMFGAKILLIWFGDAYIVPYIDNVDSAEQLDDRFLVLGDGDINCNETCGYSGSSPCDNEDDCSTCEHCGDHYNPEDGEATAQYCEHCYNRMGTCDLCERHVWRGDYRTINGATWCTSCISEHTHICENEGCTNSFITEQEFAEDEQATRQLHGTHDLCRTCADRYSYCDHCEVSYDPTVDSDNGNCPQCDRSGRSEDTLDLFATGLAPLGIPRPIEEYQTLAYSDRGVLQETMRRAVWRVAGTPGRCLIARCHAYIETGELYLQGGDPHGFPYCAECATPQAPPRPTPPVPVNSDRPNVGQLASEHASAF